jgi:hypothetical protein
MIRKALIPAMLLVSACSPSNENQTNAASAPEIAENVTAAPQPDYANMAIEVPEPGQPGGLPDDRTPLAEGPITPGSAAEAGQVVQSYGALIEQKRFGEAAALWETPPDLAAQFARYARIGANIGAPGQVDAGAGQLHVAVPIQLYGRLDDGQVVNGLGTVTLHRVNDVDGSTPEQRKWRIVKIDADPRPFVK